MRTNRSVDPLTICLKALLRDVEEPGGLVSSLSFHRLSRPSLHPPSGAAIHEAQALATQEELDLSRSSLSPLAVPPFCTAPQEAIALLAKFLGLWALGCRVDSLGLQPFHIRYMTLLRVEALGSGFVGFESQARVLSVGCWV